MFEHHPISKEIESTSASLDREEILDAYITTALWSSLDDDDQPLDADYTEDDIADESKAKAVQDIAAFLVRCSVFGLIDKLIEDSDLYGSSQYSLETKLGHDFWLTRNHHGVGFWDRGLGDLGDRLTRQCEISGESDAYVGDDDKVYLT